MGIEYSRRCAPLSTAVKKLDLLELELEHMKQHENIKNELEREKLAEYKKSTTKTEEDNKFDRDIDKSDLKEIEHNVKILQERYDKSIDVKHRLKLKLESLKSMIITATTFIENSRSLETKLKKAYTVSITKEELVTNCILASCFIVYCSQMTIYERKRMTKFYTRVCKHYDLSIPGKLLFKNLKFSEFFETDNRVQENNDNNCLVNVHFDPVWPLVCDPHGGFCQWFASQNKNANIILHENLKNELETCLSEGKTLLISYCDVNILSRDEKIIDFLRSSSKFFTEIPHKTFKTKIGKLKVECNSSFKLIIHTIDKPQYVPDELSSKTRVINYQYPSESVESHLLYRFLVV